MLRLIVFIAIFISNSVSDNLTFTPTAIRISLNELPDPYATSSVRKSPKIVSPPSNPKFYLPENFTISVYKDDLNRPRWLCYTPTGDLLVTEIGANKITILIDTNNDSYPDETQTFADSSNGLNQPIGMVFFNGYFYVGNQVDVRRYPYQNGSRSIQGTGQILMRFPGGGHWTRNIVIAPTNDRLYVTIGSASNVDEEPSPRATVQVINLDGTNNHTFVSGVRNPVGLAFHPVTNDLYAAVQERDLLGDDLVPDYFTHIQQDEFYGWPYSYLSSKNIDPRRRFTNGTSERPDLVAQTKSPDVLFQAHSAVLDMRFYTGKSFPQRYQNGAFATLRGSWNKNTGTGYKIVFIPFGSDNRPLGYYEDFIYGFLTKPEVPETFGRPVGLLVLKDGSLLLTEDGNGRIYRVQFNGSNEFSFSYVVMVFITFAKSLFTLISNFM
ncbi:unnamed protein product [Didymodactylos carnosus]|uniref:Pyrroloquinoline quinone-dependent pyranose dehydrogenase beta-propeller domain-containing protein n=1 Tax=Didymodactylos carnosus TaxID=1234261 RepID=A0A815JKV4_9BILA|nr:unnamed protein product [Didymodactylos carnosus]CAF1381247.1 unnamed protein product [Didymodactylos carnosus]CAF4056485.1 unnamed protein product [Didymodactylos carnosus]CAF4276232.1 unnamed protein product [Didymodactylos carnosus]